ncbi:MAG: GDSL-type esterase/lipase family protein [Prevotellaceae bacterium]|jgi:hypothetical protein|nr:GDSL-type esterase/lipase family protein [Prevotellaceae bacterium]
MKLRVVLLLSVFLSASGIALSRNDSVHIMEYLPVKHSDSKKWIERYQKDIDRYVRENIETGESDCDALFLGSSSINMWNDIYEDMAPLKVVRRSYGGASIRDMLYNYSVIARGFKPKNIVLYVENDLCGCPEELPEHETFDLFRIFTLRILRDYPRVPFFIVSLKPSPAREKAREKQKIVNRLLQSFAENTPDVFFIDVASAMYDERGNLRTDIFLDDNLHLNRKGYDIWKSIFKAAIK